MIRQVSTGLVALAAAALVAGCGGGTAGTSPTSAPASQAAPATTPVATTPSPTTDPEQEKKAVQAASTKFVETALTIGYPDTSFDDYLGRLKPLMTKTGFAASESDKPANADKTLKALSASRTRSTAKPTGDPAVSGVTADAATAKVAYKVVNQVKSGSDWKTVKTSPSSSVTLKLAKQDGKWLVDDAT